jgi:molybdopterin-guanine dinucleotide biosynthesis protein A
MDETLAGALSGGMRGADDVVLGVLVGGRSRRMGIPKGRLPVPGGDEPILARLVRVGREAGFRCVLVGDAEPYVDLALDVTGIADRPTDVGPLGGLGGLMEHAAATGARFVILVACDMPFVSASTLVRLGAAPSTAAVVAPVREGRVEPMLARYEVAVLRPHLEQAVAGGTRSFQDLLRSVEVAPFEVDDAELVDFDTPLDRERHSP